MISCKTTNLAVQVIVILLTKSFKRDAYSYKRLIKASAHSFKRFTSRLLKVSVSLSMHLLLWMNVMLDFIWTLAVQLRGTRNKWTLQKILSTVGFEPPTPHPNFPARPSNHSATGAVYDMWLKPLQYLFTPRCYKNSVWCAKGYIENKHKIIAFMPSNAHNKQYRRNSVFALL